MLPIKCTPCRVKYQGDWYKIENDGTVYPTRFLGIEAGIKLWDSTDKDNGNSLDDIQAKLVRREASRQRRNRNARERNSAMRDLGMKRTSYGWE